MEQLPPLVARAEAVARQAVITGDALRAIPGRGPFDLLFADRGVRDRAGFAALVSAEVVLPALHNSLLVGTRFA